MPSNPGLAPNKSNGRYAAAEDDWLEEPASQGSSYELIEIEDRGEYTEHKNGNVDLYWNSVMAEASPEEGERWRVIEETRRKEKRSGRVFDNTEQLYQAFNKRQPHPRSSAVPEQGVSASKLRSSLASADDIPHPATQSDIDATEDYHIILTENACVTQCNAQRADTSRLTWNSALTRIQASPGIDPSVASEIKARAGRASDNKAPGDEEVDMRAVAMVPNFSYPIANARWCDACHASDWPCLDGTECDNSDERQSPPPDNRNDITTDTSNDDVSFLHLAQSNDIDVDSLYRESMPTATSHRSSDPGSVLRDILEPEEWELYQKIIAATRALQCCLTESRTGKSLFPLDSVTQSKY